MVLRKLDKKDKFVEKHNKQSKYKDNSVGIFFSIFMAVMVVGVVIMIGYFVVGQVKETLVGVTPPDNTTMQDGYLTPPGFNLFPVVLVVLSAVIILFFVIQYQGDSL